MYKEYIAYLKDNPQGYWFKRKLYGYGWTPARWQGWFVLFIYALLIICTFNKIDAASHSGSDTLLRFAVPFLVMTFILLLITYTKGEKLKWQWGVQKR